MRAGGLTWRYLASPTPLSREYSISIRYRQGGSPKTFVDGPDLPALAAGRRLPHVYKQHPTELCLYLPGSGQWTAIMRLDLTIVPWSYLWLFYFEDWLATDEWKGGGTHPSFVRGRRRSCAHASAG